MNRIETRTSSIWLGDDDVLRGVFKKGANETLETCIENVAAAKELADGRKLLVIIDMSELEQISRDARNYYAGEEPASYSLGQALITNSTVSRVIGNFFIGLNKASHPVRLVKTEEDALKWLNGL